MGRQIKVSIIAYVAGSVLDFSLTTYMTRIGKFREANPVLAPIIGSFNHILLEVFFFLFLILLSYLTKRTMRHIGVKSSVQEKTWIFFLLPAIIRWSAVVHNLILLTLGFESPLSSIYKYI